MPEEHRCEVAAVQMRSQPGDVARNLETAERLIENAVATGAHLVLLPELAASGYQLSPAMWATAEPLGGPVTRWLCDTAAKHRIYVGTTILEVDAPDFHNTFLLATPEGRLAGTVRKSDPAWVEARYYRGHQGSHVIETALGRIGVGICYENYLTDRARELSEGSIDILLQPTAAATPPPSFPVGVQGAKAFDTMLGALAQDYARLLGVPVVMANMCGPLFSPFPGPMRQLKTVFPGLSSIVSGSGTTLAEMGSDEGVIGATVVLGRSRNKPAKIARGRWAVQMPWYAPAWPIIQRISAIAYDRDDRRKAAAAKLAASKREPGDEQARTDRGSR